MLLSEVTEGHIGHKISIDRSSGKFVGVVAWVDRKQYQDFNREKYTKIEFFGKNRSVEDFLPYTGQKDYYHIVTEVEVGFYGNKSLKTTWKEEYDIAEQDPNLEAYLRKYHTDS